MLEPLAERMRPRDLSEVVGQEHILGENGLLKRIIDSGNFPNMIFYGPSGVGKTTVARIIAEKCNKKLCKMNGTTASTADIKELISGLDGFDSMGGVVLYLDEIQYLNKRQQQTLLEFIENGSITLIASTTENPYFYVYSAILSRCTVFEFKAVSPNAVENALNRALTLLEGEVTCDEGVTRHIALSCGGDVRKSMNALEVLYLAAGTGKEKHIRLEDAKIAAQRSNMHYDKLGDTHYDLLSALQKSIRGSDPDAALFYLAKLLEAGDILSPCRRLLVIASEDVGMAYPMAITIVKSCVDAARELGLPEARIPLAEAAVFLATQPKSNSSYLAYGAAEADVKMGMGQVFPRCLQNVHYDGAEVENKGQNYKYPHNYKNHYIEQQYLPDDVKDRVYYKFGDNKIERAAEEYWKLVKNS